MPANFTSDKLFGKTVITGLRLSALVVDILAQYLPLHAISALHAHKPLVSGLFERRGGLFWPQPPSHERQGPPALDP